MSIHVASNRTKDAALRALLAKAKERNVPVRFEQRDFFERMPFKAHQGVVAIAPPFPYALALRSARAPATPDAHRLLVVLDHLTDPHNVGAIVRTAEAAGADGVVLPARRSAGINATVRKAAAGAAAYLPIARVAQYCRGDSRDEEGTASGSSAPTLRRRRPSSTKADLAGDLALVIGGEGSGLSQLVKRECDYLVRIPMRGRVASLNASVASAILIYEALRQREWSLRP